MTLQELNALSVTAAENEFRRCCAAKRWCRLMAERRPFASLGVVLATAERLWWSLEAADWLEAFAAHPRIGERAAGWSAEEQSRADGMDDTVRARLVRGNHDYEARFGYTFIVCATDKAAEEMLEILDSRLVLTGEDELQVAAAEQRKISELRLRRLLT